MNSFVTLGTNRLIQLTKNDQNELCTPNIQMSEDDKSRAGHFRYFLIFSIIKNDFLHVLSS